MSFGAVMNLKWLFWKLQNLLHYSWTERNEWCEKLTHYCFLPQFQISSNKVKSDRGDPLVLQREASHLFDKKRGMCQHRISTASEVQVLWLFKWPQITSSIYDKFQIWNNVINASNEAGLYNFCYKVFVVFLIIFVLPQSLNICLKFQTSNKLLSNVCILFLNRKRLNLLFTIKYWHNNSK